MFGASEVLPDIRANRSNAAVVSLRLLVEMTLILIAIPVRAVPIIATVLRILLEVVGDFLIYEYL